jgi:hypothetical protein
MGGVQRVRRGDEAEDEVEEVEDEVEDVEDEEGRGEEGGWEMQRDVLIAFASSGIGWSWDPMRC